MLAISKRQMMVLLIVLVSLAVAVAASTAIIQATNPNFLHHVQQFVVGNGYF